MIDVCLLLEGTYPYVAGGVSTWIHQLISSMKNIHFGIVYIAPHSDPTRRMKYEMPSQVLSLKEIYLHDYQLSHAKSRQPKARDYEIIKKFYKEILVDQQDELFPEFIKLFQRDGGCFDGNTLFSSKEIWDILTEFYDAHSPDISFLDYFWTWRGTHLPLFQILQADIPRAKIYHAVSTGYAGLLGSMAKNRYGGKFFLTEHGIYTHERMLEISQANWIYEQEKKNYRAERELSFFKQWWIGIFSVLSRLTYNTTDRIFTLYEGNRIREILEGANPTKISLIPNGIDIQGAKAISRQKKEFPQIGLIGRVVNIKDIKTYIQAARLTLQKIPQAKFYILGPTEEEGEYFEECKMLVEALQLQNHIVFTGRVNLQEYYSFLDVVVLTSLSEAQPYVILEANIVGIPVVATNVGACREMLEGGSAEDQALGMSGLITEVTNPESTSASIVRLLEDKEFYNKCAASGIERVKKYYDQDDLLSRYLNIYEQNL